MVKISPNTVFVASSEVQAFANHWPCSGMRFVDEIVVSFEFDSRGNLVDVCWFNCSEHAICLDTSEPAGVNGEALKALSEDAGERLKNSEA